VHHAIDAAMTVYFLLASLLALQAQPGDPVLAARIQQLLHTVLTADGEQEEAAVAEARQIFLKHGLPTIADVGDEAAYEFVVLTCSPGPADSQAKVLAKASRALAKRELARDAVLYCEARIRQEKAKARAERHPPTHPTLRDQIQRLYLSDQAVRQTKDFDTARMEQVDRENEGPLKDIFEKYGVPTYAMVGVEAAASFLTMVQHQSPELRRQVLPKLKANVEAGQADSGYYAMVYDRSSGDAGRKQLYGENLECSNEDPTLHATPIEDEAHVNIRRAQLGLMRVELYARMVIELSPAVCPAAASSPQQ
jgi:uncharacterized protein DUF6624